ncbi:PREDICTED: omega-theraphotoxin-Hg1a-like [Wasmannia auropunctata]|uniref:omega-theraphotoxin-Hg1a-like n=1 Tax=Wasmannia auropunctata TaxID=64793 RepID=UPI0005EF9494|nr:PREDICTED: omega-theraphotoxin-Hg1a-like [Wasmannia auropunctata]
MSRQDEERDKIRYFHYCRYAMAILLCYVDKPGCRYLFGGCSQDDNCCPKLVCPYGYCAWDGSFGKKETR